MTHNIKLFSLEAFSKLLSRTLRCLICWEGIMLKSSCQPHNQILIRLIHSIVSSDQLFCIYLIVLFHAFSSISPLGHFHDLQALHQSQLRHYKLPGSLLVAKLKQSVFNSNNGGSTTHLYTLIRRNEPVFRQFLALKAAHF